MSNQAPLRPGRARVRGIEAVAAQRGGEEGDAHRTPVPGFEFYFNFFKMVFCVKMNVFADNIPERGEEGREAPVADGQAGRKDHKREGQGGGGSKVKKKYFLLCETVVLLQEQLFAFCYVFLINDSENKMYRNEKRTCNLIS